MKKNSDIGFFTKILLKVITFLQEACLKQDNDLYYPLTKLHFRLFFGKNLVEEAVNNSMEFRVAAVRHIAMVMTIVHKTQKGKKGLARAIGRAFQKNLLLEADL